MSDTYAKLFRSIAASTIVSEPLATRWLWITLLSQADRAGKVYGSIPGLARLANITVTETEAALAALLGPDPYSRTPDNEGRRLEAIDGGWRLLNYAKYDAMRSEAERKEYKRQWDRDHRPSGHQRAKNAAPEGDESTGTESDSPITVRQSDSSPIETRQSDPMSHVSCLMSHEDQERLSATGVPPAAPKRRQPIPVQAVVDAYNTTLTRLSKVRSVTAKRKRAIERLWLDSPIAGDLDLFQQYFEECAADPFLSGEGPYRNGHENWRPDFDYLIRPDVVTKTYERAMDAIDRGNA